MPRAQTRWRRVRAILAGGLVLGVGASITLASWNDSEYATGSFQAGVFGIEGSATGLNYTDHPSGAPAQLSFAPTVGAMAPGNSSYALFSVKTVINSVAGTVQVTAAGTNAAAGSLGEYLRYEIRTIAGTTCNATTFGAGATMPMATPTTLAVSPTAAQAIGANGGTVNYCFRFELPTTADNGAQGKSLTARWTFTATSS